MHHSDLVATLERLAIITKDLSKAVGQTIHQDKDITEIANFLSVQLSIIEIDQHNFPPEIIEEIRVDLDALSKYKSIVFNNLTITARETEDLASGTAHQLSLSLRTTLNLTMPHRWNSTWWNITQTGNTRTTAMRPTGGETTTTLTKDTARVTTLSKDTAQVTTLNRDTTLSTTGVTTPHQLT